MGRYVDAKLETARRTARSSFMENDMRKFNYMVKGVNNPITEFMTQVLRYDKTKNRGNVLIVTKLCTLSELDEYIDRANAAWEFACDCYFNSNKPIELEVSTKNMGIEPQLCGRCFHFDDPYIQVKCGTAYYRLRFPEFAHGNYDIEQQFGDFYRLEDIRGAIKAWLDGDYAKTIELIWPKQTKEGTMKAVQETDLFVFWKGKVWSVDSGERVSDCPPKGLPPSVFEYKRCNYQNTELVCSLTNSHEEMEVCEIGDTNVECYELCELKLLDNEWLCKLETLYRDGRSNLPDHVFDDIMEFLGMSEERLQKLCNKAAKSFGHDNSYGVSSERDDKYCNSKRNYPAEAKILSQDKVRDANKLEDIVKSWNGKAVMSWKLDGCAVRLHYKGTQFVRAESKGKAREVSELMKNVDGFPETITHGLPFLEKEFVNVEWFVTGELVAQNERRSVAAGYLLRKDANSEETVDISRKLRFVVYDSDICKSISVNPNVAPIRLYSQMLNLLKEAGFDTVGLFEFVDAKQISNIYDDYYPPQEFDIDGLVVRVNDIAKYESLGETQHHPKGSVAFKFEDEWHRVKPNRIYGKRGENGVIKLIAEFNSVTIDGKKVKSAVWQPKDDGGYSLECTRRYEEYKVFYRGEEFEKYFNVDKIEVCLRGKVIPQWRLVGEQ